MRLFVIVLYWCSSCEQLLDNYLTGLTQCSAKVAATSPSLVLRRVSSRERNSTKYKFVKTNGLAGLSAYSFRPTCPTLLTNRPTKLLIKSEKSEHIGTVTRSSILVSPLKQIFITHKTISLDKNKHFSLVLVLPPYYVI